MTVVNIQIHHKTYRSCNRHFLRCTYTEQMEARRIKKKHRVGAMEEDWRLSYALVCQHVIA